MIKDIFIGVDGGGTKCKVRIEDSQGQVIGQGMGGPANIRLSVATAWQSIYSAIEDALKDSSLSLANPNYRFHAGLGLAGCEMKSAYELFLQQPHPFYSLHLTSDAHVACLGAHNGQDGAIIVVGTGIVGYQILHDECTKVGGWGFPHDDLGSGAWLGLEAARLTFQWLDHRVEKSPLIEDVFAFFNKDSDQLISWANHANSSEFARLAPLVINHSQQEEANAVRLIKKAAHAVEKISTALIKTQQNKEETVGYCLFGGIAPFIEPWLHESLRARIIPRKTDANKGAILMMRKEHAAKQAITT